VCRATSANAWLMTSARVSLARGRGRTRRLDPTFSIQVFDRQPSKSSRHAVGFAMGGEAWRPFDVREEAEALFFGPARR
jgi:hypothetical protein